MFKKKFWSKPKREAQVAFGKTDVGKVRANNEDAFLLIPEKNIFLIADGMGGHSAGEVASTTALSAVKTYIENREFNDVPEKNIGSILVKAMTEAQNTVKDLRQKEERYSDMGCTLIATMVRDHTLYFCHSGDSRLYIIGPETIKQLTTDHSVVMELVAHGTISIEEARISPLKNQLTQGVGTYSFDPECGHCELKKNDRILLCTDGLWDMLMDSEIHDLVKQGGSAEEICTRLIDAANANGGKDNITVIFVKQEVKDESNA